MNFELKEWKKEYAKDIVLAANNKNIAKNLRNVFPNPYTLEDAQWYVNDCISKGNEKQCTKAIVVDDKAVGSIGVFIQDDVFEKSGELGYWLAEEYWGKGIMSAAAKQICKEVFSKYDVGRIYAEPFDYNIGSRRVLEKAGFTYEGTMRQGVCKNGKVFSYCMYSILRNEI